MGLKIISVVVLLPVLVTSGILWLVSRKANAGRARGTTRLLPRCPGVTGTQDRRPASMALNVISLLRSNRSLAPPKPTLLVAPYQ